MSRRPTHAATESRPVRPSARLRCPRPSATAHLALCAALLFLLPNTLATPLSDPIPQFNSTQSFTCQLVNSSDAHCGPWKGYRVPVQRDTSTLRGGAEYDFDDSIIEWAVGRWGIAQFNSFYGCNWDGAGLRYHLTFGCSVAVVEHSECQQYATPLLCKSTCLLYLSSVKTIFSNAYICPSTASSSQIAARATVIDTISRKCDARGTLVQDGGGCVGQVGDEGSRCGFLSFAVAILFCRSFPSSSLPACCTSLRTDRPSYGPEFDITGLVLPLFLQETSDFSLMSDVSTSPRLTTPAMAGVVVASVAALAVLATLAYVFRARIRATVDRVVPFRRRTISRKGAKLGGGAGAGVLYTDTGLSALGNVGYVDPELAWKGGMDMSGREAPVRGGVR
ncbi:hypothetical protein M427DRAFT_151815 [Gonapodya prolifera JEL478]|uniref:Uncharacterized protein n=1 Tax=Gonapodya prolifera (strain JEL478) TaxID=1344416 RepID=A0A139AV79_GONPJ|nr:hypothetical protein M427DRAFT_151815 [Gonapodya prolifera JEL478]|eukprot:KXS20483.1 hypothetical protein M427DRAFT_151815 [Gonapodya prolifera JEL478]